MNIPAIGTARGVFELLVPGAFVILNAFAVLYSMLDSTAQGQFRELAASPVLGLVILICLGYLVGAILRLFGTEMPDRWSARWNRLWHRHATIKTRPTLKERLLALLKWLLAWLRRPQPKGDNGEGSSRPEGNGGQSGRTTSNETDISDDTAEDKPNLITTWLAWWKQLSKRTSDWWNPKAAEGSERFKSWAYESLPYIKWTGLTHGFYGKTAETDERVQEFYRNVWKKVKSEGGNEQTERWREKTFFNHCKTLINSVDERAATEIYSAEALVRYLTGMFYALLIAPSVMLVGLVLQFFFPPPNWGWVMVFGVLALVYLLMLLPIIRHYRIMRIKEVEIVFSATYRNRELLEPPERTECPFPGTSAESCPCHPCWK